MKCIRKTYEESSENKRESALYSDYKSKIKPLDLVLFRGKDFISDTIRYLERKTSKGSSSSYKLSSDSFTHVGIVITSDVLNGVIPPLEEGKLYIWESTMSGPLNDGVYNIQGETFLGVQIRDLDEVVKVYSSNQSSEVAIAPLKISYPINEVTKSRLDELYTSLNGVRYDANPYSLASAFFPCLRPVRDEVEKISKTEKWMFCSEFVATVYREMDILPRYIDPRNVLPMDFVGYDIDKDLPIVVEEPITMKM